MAEEVALSQSPAPAPAPAPADLKRKLDDVHDPTDPILETDRVPHTIDAAVASDSFGSKRPRFDDDFARENGCEKVESEEKEEEEETREANASSKQVEETVQPTEVKAKTADDDDPQVSVENGSETQANDTARESKDEIPEQEIDESQPTTRKIEVPSSKVGVLIGKGGDTIRYLQYNSGAKIQILRDADADPNSSTRPVEIVGNIASIEKAEKLIHAVIAEADAGGSPSLVARGLPTAQAAGVAEQIEIKVPNDKVGLIIGRGGETIKNMQTRSGARIQLIPQHQEGDGSKERMVRISGDKKQIEMASEMIKDVMNQTARPPFSGGFNQPAFRPRGPAGPPQWGSRGPHAPLPTPYDYHHRGPYQSQSSHYHPPSYGNYPPQNMPPRGNFSAGWEQRPPHSGGYDYYARQGSQISSPHSAPVSGHAPGSLPSPAMGQPPSQANYNYGQAHGPDYGHAGPYLQTAPQQSYGQAYEQPNPPTQQPYGGHGSSQPSYVHAGGQPGYAQQQQQGKPPSYGMQGPNPQAYGPPRAGTPGDISYQGVAQSSQSYASNVAPQQQYSYASSGPMQQSYPSYGSGAPPDGYNQQVPPTGLGYQQQGVQPVAANVQPGGQPASTGYGQVASTGVYGSYPSSQQAYPEQPAQNSGNYGFQDPSYGSATGSAYAATPSGQPAYTQPIPAQPTYEQSATQSAGYAAAPSGAPVKSLSPQHAYPQYDATNQMYAAPR